LTFQNLQIDADSLPRAEEIEFRPVEPAYPRLVRLVHLIVFASITFGMLIPGTILIVVFGTTAAWILAPLLPAIPLTLGLILTPLAVRRARTTGLALREHDIAYRRGILFRKVVVLPFNRLQHAEVSSGPLQRRYGLTTLKLYTAGASGIDLQIDGLTPDSAAAIRKHIADRSTTFTDREAGPVDG
jgi:membrane protein YdbS with pleckstrin-like domain